MLAIIIYPSTVEPWREVQVHTSANIATTIQQETSVLPTSHGFVLYVARNPIALEHNRIASSLAGIPIMGPVVAICRDEKQRLQSLTLQDIRLINSVVRSGASSPYDDTGTPSTAHASKLIFRK